jgi:hypothetical protein
MNAAEQVKSFGAVSKVAALVNLLKLSFPGAITDLEPWLNDATTRQCLSPESLDLALHLPHKHPQLGCSSLLIEIHFESSDDIGDGRGRVLGVDVHGYDRQQSQWHFSTVNNCQFTGTTGLAPESRELMRTIYRNVISLFTPVDLERQVWFT